MSWKKRKGCEKYMSKGIVIGGGPAGLMSAYAASQAGHSVELFEKNAQFKVI